MASTKEYLDFVMEQLSGLDEVSSRAMMGEYILYYRGRIFGGVYDDRLLVKPVPMALRLMPKNRKRECANEAQTLVVWAFSNFDRNLRTIIFKKSIINL